MLEKDIVKEIGEKYNLTEKQSMEMYNQFIDEYLMFNLYNMDWQFLNYPGLGVFSMSLSTIRARMHKTKIFIDKIKDKEISANVLKKAENDLKKYEKIDGYINSYLKKYKHKKLNG